MEFFMFWSDLALRLGDIWVLWNRMTFGLFCKPMLKMSVFFPKYLVYKINIANFALEIMDVRRA